MNILLNPTYFANILHWCALVKSNQVSFEVCDSYQKQTYRNRTHIYSANGTLALSIPVVSGGLVCEVPRENFSSIYCANSACNVLMVQCPSCANDMNNTCGSNCKDFVALPPQEQKAQRQGTRPQRRTLKQPVKARVAKRH